MVPSQDVISFKSNLPIFASINDADVAAALNTASVMVPDDGTWSETDYPLALRYYAAWLLSMIQLQSWSASLMSLSGSSMAGGAADLYVSAIRFGERDVSFGRRVPVLSNRTTLGPGEDLLSLNIWGQMFQQLRYRNVVPVMIV